MAWYWPFRERKYTSVDLARDLLGPASAKTGIPVNWETALQCGVAFACARVIANGLSQVPFRLMREQSGKREPARDHPLYGLFAWAPNEWQTSTELVEQLALHLIFAGNAFVWKNRVRGQIAELLPFEKPADVQVTRDLVNWSLTYRASISGVQQIIPPDEIWHLKGPSWNGWQGLDGVKLAREAIGLALAEEGHGAASFKNGSMLSGILTTDANLNSDQRKSLRESFEQVYGGLAGSGKVAVMSNGMKFVQMSASNIDAQWNEARRMQVEEVCRAFGVMPIMVGFSDKTSTYASAEQMFIAHVVHTLGPWYARIEQSAAVNLLTPQEREQGYYFKFFTQALLRGAAKDRGDFYTKMLDRGVFNPNEVRAYEDMNPYAGGDVYRVPMNTVDTNAQENGSGTP